MASIEGVDRFELGPEPPAVVGLLIDGHTVAAPTAAATLLDLAARRLVGLEQVAPGRSVVRIRPAAPAASDLTGYEGQVLRLVEHKARGGSAPVEALELTGPDGDRWRAEFSAAVVADAVARGLLRRHRTSRIVAAFVGLVTMMGSPRSRRVRPTPAGHAALVRWLDVRAHLALDESFAEQPPAAVAIWGRHLAYGVALGVNRAAAVALPVGPEDPDHVWSRRRGTWRRLRIRYPSGAVADGSPVAVLLTGALGTVGWSAVGVVLFLLAASIIRDGSDALSSAGSLITTGVIAIVVCVPVLLGVYVLVRIVRSATLTGRGIHDLRRRETVTGPVVKVHAGFFAVDDGTGDELRALRSPSTGPPPLDHTVRVVFTPRLRHVDELEVIDHDREGKP